ncbi:fumarylacetoacetate hydrolase family protein [Salinibacterium sp. TMP30]|uniref:fumarylacetoacetate hydrolase family protein n=1 Tax=Salinibacterium sp. TMP30 TaxID=3138237 RepID=UPI0031391A74
MKLARLGELGHEIPVVIDGDTTFDISALRTDFNAEFFESGGLDEVRSALLADDLPEVPYPTSMRIGAPIARPSAVVCVGMNYAAHAAESGAEPPTEPILFLKTPNTVVGPNDSVKIPRNSVATDWEVELGIVIGARAANLERREDSPNHIAGFVMANDVSERDYQLKSPGGQWSKGKCAPGFNPVGPWLVTSDSIDHKNLRLRSWVNGETRQDSSTSDMIFDVDYIVWYVSQFLTLEPGDLVLTGTPEGVALSGRFPFLADQDVVEMEIEGLGHQRQEFVRSE